MEEVYVWLDESDPETLFLALIVRRAAPLMVDTVTQQAEIKRRYKLDAQVITSCPTIFFSNSELTVAAQQSVRERHHVPGDSFLISTFGAGNTEKGMEAVLFAVVTSDVAVQLRTYAFGRLSIALAAGIPRVANDDLPKSCSFSTEVREWCASSATGRLHPRAAP